MITFKVDESFLEAMKGVDNRSEFIRSAILSALDNQCPLCKGTGVLSPQQKEHWNAFERDHSIQECDKCHEIKLVCANRDASSTED